MFLGVDNFPPRSFESEPAAGGERRELVHGIGSDHTIILIKLVWWVAQLPSRSAIIIE